MRVGSKKNRVGQKNAMGSFRVIAGEWRSRRLSFPEVDGLRPTTDRVRETLFNWLSPTISGAYVLDLFSGSGALGFEALSRGAQEATFIEKDSLAYRSLNNNILELNAGVRATVIQADALAWLDHYTGSTYDLIFLDPPFRQNLLEPAIEGLVRAHVLSTGTLIYLEQEKELSSTLVPDSWQLKKEKVAGQVAYRLYEVALAKE